MSLNLDKYKDSMVEAWRDVMNGKSPTNWALFGYDGQTFDLKLISKGDGGIEEMIDDLNSGKIMYGLCRVTLQDKNMDKVALINWQGEGAPLARKGTCANHMSTVKNFFKGVHVTITARTDEDVEPELIISQVAKATSGIGIRMSSSMESDVAPVGAIYKRVNPKEEINSQAKNDFWLKEEKEEERRRKDEQSKYHKFSHNEVQLLRRESQDYFENEEKNSDVFVPTSPSPMSTMNGSIKTNGDITNNSNHHHHNILSPTSSSGLSSGKSSTLGFTSPIDDGRKSVSPTPAFSTSFVASEKAAALKACLPRKNNNENLVRQRVKSFDGNSFEITNNASLNYGRGGGSSRNSSTSEQSPEGESLNVLRRKQMFENGGASNAIKTNGRISVSDEIKQLQEESLKAAQAKNPQSISNNRQPSPIEPAAVDNQPQIISSPVKMRSPSPQPIHVPFQSKTVSQPIKAYNLPFHIGGSVTGKLAQQVNRNTENSNGVVNNGTTETGHKNGVHHYEPEKKNQVQQQEQVTSIEPPAHFKDNNYNSNHINSEIKQQLIRRTPSPALVQTKSPSPVPTGIVNKSPTPHDGRSTPTNNIEITSAMGLCARALYDYQAADETEITFDPGELITHIERIDEGWWEGMGPAGLYGLFPANYVELIN